MAQRLAFVDARFVVHSVLYEDKVREVAKLLPGVFFVNFGSAAVDYLLERGAAAVANGEATSVFETEPDEDALASIVFTSGTTAKPRGVELTLRSFSMFPASAAKVLPVKPGDRSLMVLPLHHIFGIASTYFLLARGAALGVCPDFRRLFDAVQRFRATRLFLVPALADILAHKIGHRTTRPDGMPNGIEWILTGGAPLPRRIYENLQSFGIRMLEGYGLTETCSLYSLAPYGAPHVGTAGLVSPLPEVETKVAEDGELLIRGPNVMRRYYNDPVATAKVLEDGWFHTGDTGEIDKRAGESARRTAGAAGGACDRRGRIPPADGRGVFDPSREGRPRPDRHDQPHAAHLQAHPPRGRAQGAVPAHGLRQDQGVAVVRST